MARLLAITGLAFVLTVVGTVALPAPEARAETYVYYYDAHPIPEAFGGGFCYEEGPHYHVYAPVEPDFYVYHDGYYVFTGDPWFYGYTGSLYWYHDPHPVHLHWGVDVCYILGPHRHWYTPHYNRHDWYHSHGYYYYRGSMPRHYRPARHVSLARHYPQRYRHYERQAPRTPPPARPPAASRMPRDDRGRGDRPRYGGQSTPPPRASQPPERPRYSGDRGRDGERGRPDGRAPAPAYRGRDGTGDRSGAGGGAPPTVAPGKAPRGGDSPAARTPGRTPRAGDAPAATAPGRAPRSDGRAPAARTMPGKERGTAGRGTVGRPTPTPSPSRISPAPSRTPRTAPAVRTPTKTERPRVTTPPPSRAPKPTYRTHIQRSRTPAMSGGTPSAKRYYAPPSRPSGGSKPAFRGGGGRPGRTAPGAVRGGRRR